MRQLFFLFDDKIPLIFFLSQKSLSLSLSQTFERNAPNSKDEMRSKILNSTHSWYCIRKYLEIFLSINSVNCPTERNCNLFDRKTIETPRATTDMWQRIHANTVRTISDFLWLENICIFPLFNSSSRTPISTIRQNINLRYWRH